MNDWHKSSYSNTGANCVEVRERSEAVDVRDTQNRSLGHLGFAGAEWSAALSAIRTDQA